MTAPHFFAADVSGDRVLLSGEDAKHAAAALRIRPGESITVSDGRGSVVEAEVIAAGSRELVAEVRARRSEAPPRPRITVFQAIPKLGKLDLVVQKLTELGVHRIAPFSAARSVSKWDPAKAEAQTRRLGAIARSAAEQSRRAWLSVVDPPVPIESLHLPPRTLVLHEEAEARLRTALPAAAPEEIGIVVGPEGGLSEKELGSLAERGAIPVSLGPAILRTETAALAATAIVTYTYGFLG